MQFFTYKFLIITNHCTIIIFYCSGAKRIIVQWLVMIRNLRGLYKFILLEDIWSKIKIGNKFLLDCIW
jgi:hypothetical protein